MFCVPYLIVPQFSFIVLFHCCSDDSHGYYLFRFASSIDSLLEDEEQFADQLKEYYYYGDALRFVNTGIQVCVQLPDFLVIMVRVCLFVWV